MTPGASGSDLTPGASAPGVRSPGDGSPSGGSPNSGPDDRQPDDLQPSDGWSGHHHPDDDLDTLRRAVYAPGGSAGDARAYEQALARRQRVRIAGRDPAEDDPAESVTAAELSERVESEGRGPTAPALSSPAPMTPVSTAAMRRRPRAVLAGGAVLLAAVATLCALALIRAGTAAAPRPSTSDASARSSASPSFSGDVEDLSTRFREGSGGATGPLPVPTIAGTILVVRSDAGTARPAATVDGLGGRLEFAITCQGPGTVILRLDGTGQKPDVCRADRPTPGAVVVLGPSVHAVQYSVGVQGTARWALVVGRTSGTGQ